MRTALKRVVGVGIASAALLAPTLVFSGPAQAAANAEVSVIHGIPNTPVNVFVNGKSTLKDFKPGSVAGPLSLPAGTYKVTIFAATNTKGTGTPVISASASVASGKNYSLVAHLSEAGEPTLTPYVNDVSPVAAGKARLVVRHDAAAPAVDVLANGKAAFTNLSNPKEASADLPAGSIDAAVALTGTTKPVIGPAKLDLKEGTSTIVYADGSATDKTLGLVVQTIDGLHSAPAGVQAGSGGLLTSASATPAWVWVAGIGGVLVLLSGCTGLVVSMRRND
ncbi:MAG: DUF4397 domain-containing protein [Jatrophihabitans sp.]